MPSNNKKSSKKKKSNNNNTNNSNAGRFVPGSTGHGVVDDEEGPLEFSSKPAEHRPVPNMSIDADAMKASVLSVSNPSATTKRFVRAYQLVESMEAGAKLLASRYDVGNQQQQDISIDVLKQDRDYIQYCVSLIEANALTDQRVGVTAFIYHKFPLPSCWAATTKLAPLEGKDSQI